MITMNTHIMQLQTFLVLVLISVVAGRTVVDLTHTLDKDAPKYPLRGIADVNEFNYFKENTIFENYTKTGMWLALRTYEVFEHQGTHIDAPLHFAQGRQTLSEIPPEKLVGPGVVIDVRDKVKNNANYGVTVQDILDYEKEFGKIPPGAIVMMNSGWAAKYPDSMMSFGTNNLSDSSSFNYPGWTLEACKMLLNERQMSVLGVDSPSTDPGQAEDYHCHRYLQPNQVPLLEYVANLDSIPQNGTTIILGAIKMRTGTGGATRILAFIEDDKPVAASATALTMALGAYLLATLSVFVL